MNVVLVIVNVPSLNRPPPKVPFPSMMLRPDMLTTLSLGDIEHLARVVAADRHKSSAGTVDHLRPGRVRRAPGWPSVSVMVCGGAEHGRVESDRRGLAQDVGQVDSLAEAQVARGRASAVDRGVDHQHRSGSGRRRCRGASRAGSPRWSVVTPRDGIVPAPMAGLPGEQGHGLGRPAVVAERGQAQVGEAGQDDVAVDAAGDPARAAGADQVV